MTMKFEDGSSLDTNDWQRMLAFVKQRAKEGKPKPVEIKQTTQAGTVTVKLEGLNPNPKAKGKVASGPEHSNYVESTYKGWKIRVWRMEKERIYGCNYYKDEDVRYAEVPFDDVLDENGVFKYAISIIRDYEE